MKYNKSDLLYIVKKIEEDKDGKGVFLNASAYDNNKNMYHNIRQYLPTESKNNLMRILNILQKNNNQKGAVLNFDSYDDDKKTWINMYLYFHFPVNVKR